MNQNGNSSLSFFFWPHSKYMKFPGQGIWTQPKPTPQLQQCQILNLGGSSNPWGHRDKSFSHCATTGTPAHLFSTQVNIMQDASLTCHCCEIIFSSSLSESGYPEPTAQLCGDHFKEKKPLLPPQAQKWCTVATSNPNCISYLQQFQWAKKSSFAESMKTQDH